MNHRFDCVQHRRQFFDRAAANWDALEVEETHDAIPDEGEMLRLLREAGLVDAQVLDEPDRYLALACRDGRL